ncbi:MAG: restriction endonuclease subunit S [Bacteroidaceae bacterium]|nr:restriction endonuclease subunit S [Bacteroidaceae bacterium]
MGEWKEYKLGDITSKITSGGTPKSSEASYYDGNIPWLNTKEVNFNRIVKTEKCITEEGLNNSSAKWIPKGSVIIAMYGATAAKVAYSLIDLTTNQACGNLIINNDVADSQFVYYYIQSSYEELLNLACGAAQQNLSVGVISNFPIFLPPLAVQKCIAAILSSLDDKIELLHRENTTLEAMAETLFRQWFIEEAKEDWEEGQLGDVCLYVTEKIDISNVDVDTYISTENMCPNKQGVVEASSIPENVKVTKYIQDDILLSNIRPYFKKIWLADRNGACSNDVLCIRSKSEDLKYFTYYTIRQDDFFDYVMLGAKGCKMPRGDKQHIMNWSIIIPTNDVLRRFNTIVENGMAKIRNNNKQIQTLVQTRDSLIPKLMSNEIVI